MVGLSRSDCWINTIRDMRCSERGLALIRKYEGCRLEAYRCPAGVPTIGYGHTKGVKMGQKITMAQAEALLKGDLLPIEKWLEAQNLGLRQNEFDALCSFAFNLGVNALAGSTLMKLIRQKASAEEIRPQFGRWVMAGGRKLSGLVKRREEEARMYVGG